MQAIRTRYHGATNTRGARISAQCEAGRIYVSVRFGLGRLGLPRDRMTPAWSAGTLAATGIGPIKQQREPHGGSAATDRQIRLAG